MNKFFSLIFLSFLLITGCNNDVKQPKSFVYSGYTYNQDSKSTEDFEPEKLVGYILNSKDSYKVGNLKNAIPNGDNLVYIFDKTNKIKTKDGSNCFAIYIVKEPINYDYLLLINSKVGAKFLYKK